MERRLTKWDEYNEWWIENHDNDSREWRNGGQACMDKLAAYEDAEEQGLLIRLPVARGGSIFELLGGKGCEYKIMGVDYYCMDEKGLCRGISVNGVKTHLADGSYFLTRAEAEAALAAQKEGAE
jgi:hypothetical protein